MFIFIELFTWSAALSNNDNNTFHLFYRMAAIHQAALQGNADCINLLINNGAQADIQDNKGITLCAFTSKYCLPTFIAKY